MESNIDVPIVLDKPRHLRLDLNAEEIFQELAGVQFGSVIKDLAGTASKELPVKYTKIFIYACLKHEDEGLTLNDIGRLHPGLFRSEEVQEAIGKAIQYGYSIEDTELPLAPNRAERRAAQKTKTKKPTG